MNACGLIGMKIMATVHTQRFTVIRPGGINGVYTYIEEFGGVPPCGYYIE